MTEKEETKSPPTSDAKPDGNQSEGAQSSDANPDAPSDAPLRSVHTTNFPQILQHFNASLLVTTYQAGKLVIVRPDGNVIKHPLS